MTISHDLRLHWTRHVSFSRQLSNSTRGDTGKTSNANMTTEINQYHAQADSFLARFGIKCRITLSNTKTAQWDDGRDGERNHYRVILWHTQACYISQGRSPAYGKRLTFDFWGSINDACNGVDPVAYDVLASISGEVNCPESFADFCGEYGYESDSIKALQTFRRCNAFAKRLRTFFTSDELAALSEIQ